MRALAGLAARRSSTRDCLGDNEAHRQQPDHDKSDPEVHRCRMAGQRQVAAHGLIHLFPPKDPHARGQDRKQGQNDAEHVAGTGDRQLRNQLDHRDSRGKQPQRGSLPREKSSFVGKGEAVIGLDLWRAVRRELSGGVVAYQVILRCRTLFGEADAGKPSPPDYSTLWVG